MESRFGHLTVFAYEIIHQFGDTARVISWKRLGEK